MSNVEKIFYQRPAENEVIQIKYLLQQANERGGQMHLEDVEVVYADVGKDLKRKIFFEKTFFFNLRPPRQGEGQACPRCH